MLDNDKRIFICACGNSLHHIYAYIDEEFGFCDFVIVTNPGSSFWQRLKFLFTKKEIIVGDMILSPTKLKELGETFIEASNKK